MQFNQWILTPIALSIDKLSWVSLEPNLRGLKFGKDWGQEEKGTTEDEMVGWHHRLNGHGFGWALGVGDGQGGLACCGSWGCKESDTTEWLNWTGLLWLGKTSGSQLLPCRKVALGWVSQGQARTLHQSSLLPAVQRPLQSCSSQGLPAGTGETADWLHP